MCLHLTPVNHLPPPSQASATGLCPHTYGRRPDRSSALLLGLPSSSGPHHQATLLHLLFVHSPSYCQRCAGLIGHSPRSLFLAPPRSSSHSAFLGLNLFLKATRPHTPIALTLSPFVSSRVNSRSKEWGGSKMCVGGGEGEERRGGRRGGGGGGETIKGGIGDGGGGG